MPLFQCMGKLYQLTQADLNRAPDSVLATAWNASSREAPVGLEAWPEPDLDVFEVVVGCLQQQQCAPGDSFQSQAVLHALDYFAVPEQLWPAGLQLAKRALHDFSLYVDKDKEAAQSIVSQICALALNKKKGARPQGAEEKDVKYKGTFRLSYDSVSRVYSVSASTNDGDCKPPAALQAAVTQAGRAQHLVIAFPSYNYDVLVEALVKPAASGVKRPRPTE